MKGRDDETPVLRVPADAYPEAFGLQPAACPECWHTARGLDGWLCPACLGRGSQVRLVPEWEM